MTGARHPSSRPRWGWRSVAVAVAAAVAVAGAPAAAFADPLAAQDPTTSADPATTGPAPTSAADPTSAEPTAADPSTTTDAAPSSTLDSLSPAALGAPSPTHPDEPKIGVPLETLSSDPRGAIVLDGAPIGGTGNPLALHVTVIDVRTRNILFSSDTPIGVCCFELVDKVKSYPPKSVMVVASASTPNIQLPDVGDLNSLARAVGAPELTPDAASRVREATSFTILGVPGRADGSGYTRLAPRGDTSDGGNLRGLLRWNPGPKLYSFVPSTPRVLDTSSSTTRRCDPAEQSYCTGQNTVSVDRVQTTADPRPSDTYSVELPPGKRNGFQVLSLDSRTLAVRTNDVVGTDDAESGSTPLLAALQRAFDPGPSGGIPPLVVVQSIGRPKAAQGWQASGDLLQAAGGSRQALLALDGATGDASTPSSDYTFVGSTLAGAAAVQASGKLGQQGPVTGVLQPAHDTSYLPQVSTPDGGAATGANLEQVRIDYQAPQAFPAIDPAAEAFLGKAVNLPGCADGSRPRPDGSAACSFRRQYVEGFDGDWGDYAAKLQVVAAPSPAVPGFDATKAQLLVELGTMTQVKDFYVGLASRMTAVAAGGTPNDLRKAGEQIVAAVTQTVKPPSSTFFDAMKMVSAIIGVVSLAVPELKVVWGPISAMYTLGSTIYGAAVTPDKPDNTLADAVKVQVADLGEQAQASMRNGQYVPVQEGQVVAGDWGRLQAVSRLLGQGSWKVAPQDGGFAGDIERGLRTYFYKTVISTTYPLLAQADPTNTALFDGRPAPASPQTLICYRIGAFPVPTPRFFHPWQNLPPSAATTVVTGYQPGAGGQPVRNILFPTIRGPVMDNPADDTNVVRNTIPAAVAQQAFGNDVDSGVRVNLLEFLSPRYFGPPAALSSAGKYCGL